MDCDKMKYDEDNIPSLRKSVDESIKKSKSWFK